MYGRGGAGNIAQAAASSKKAAEDTEAAHPPTTAATASNAQPSQTTAQEYAHMGRGGAGNWYQPSSLATEGTFSATTTSDATAQPVSVQRNISKPWTPEGQELPVARQGRGGAGNMVWKSEEMWRREKEEEQRRKEEIEREAKEAAGGLQSPGKAVLGGKLGGRGW